AVYAPHSMYFDRRWPTSYLEAVFNAGKNGATGGARTTVYGDREHNFFGTTWFYSARHGTNLWVRWLGLKGAGDKGGEDWEIMNEGRMCLPPMLIHPVKTVELSLTSEYTWKGENLTFK
ncbi:citrate synthase, partial [Ascosphaera pollenicola]